MSDQAPEPMTDDPTTRPPEPYPPQPPRPDAPAAAAAPGAGGPMDVTLLAQLVRLMSENDLSAVDLRDGGRRVILRRGPQIVSVPASPGATAFGAPAPATGMSSQGGPSVAPQGIVAASPGASVADDTAGLVAIKSPMVGTFYASPGPDAKPFVSVGSKVTPDSDVCVIEAMKVFNNIKAETAGVIERIVAENGKPVEYGQTLFLVRP